MKVEYGKSSKWYSENCCICKKKLSVNEPQVTGKATFLNDEVVDVRYCEPCANRAQIQEAVKQTKEMGKCRT
jgi:hypothetical protein